LRICHLLVRMNCAGLDAKELKSSAGRSLVRLIK
jgi:hypothetical protein